MKVVNKGSPREEFISCEWCNSTENLSLHYTQDFQNEILMCKKCYYAFLRGDVLCEVCKQLYHKTRFKQCWLCFKDEIIMLFECDSNPLTITQVSKKLNFSYKGTLNALLRLKNENILVREPERFKLRVRR